MQGQQTLIDAMMVKDVADVGGNVASSRKILRMMGGTVVDDTVGLPIAGSSVPTTQYFPGWATAYDQDFSLLPNQNLGTDGAVSIGSVLYNKNLSANDRSALLLVNGSGLQWQPTAAAASSSVLRLALTQVMNSRALLWSTGFRIWLYIQSNNFLHTGDNFGVGLGYYNALPISTYQAVLGRSGGGPAWYESVIVNSTTSKQFFTGTAGANEAVIVLEVPSLDSLIGRILTGPYAAGTWTSEASALAMVATADAGSAQWQDPTNPSPFLLLPSTYEVQIYGAAGTGSTENVTIGRMRIDYKL